MRSVICLATLLALSIGCGPDNAPGRKPNGDGGSKPVPTASLEGKKYLLPKEPEKARSVIDVRKAENGDEVVVAGQVGGAGDPFTEDRAVFLLADSSLKPTEGCDCPWDFCEYPKKELAAARVSVKFVDAEGKTLRAGAREMFGIKELSRVVVKGKVSRDDKDNVVVLASGIYVRPESK